MSLHKIFCLLLSSTCLLSASLTRADAHTINAMSQAIESSIRTDEDKARDGSRKPIETLTFFGLEEDMHVLELSLIHI